MHLPSLGNRHWPALLLKAVWIWSASMYCEMGVQHLALK